MVRRTIATTVTFIITAFGSLIKNMRGWVELFAGMGTKIPSPCTPLFQTWRHSTVHNRTSEMRATICHTIHHVAVSVTDVYTAQQKQRKKGKDGCRTPKSTSSMIGSIISQAAMPNRTVCQAVLPSTDALMDIVQRTQISQLREQTKSTAGQCYTAYSAVTELMPRAFPLRDLNLKC